MPLLVSQCVDSDDLRLFYGFFKVALALDKLHTADKASDFMRKCFAHECCSATPHLLTLLETDQDRGGAGQRAHGLRLVDASCLKLLSCQ